MTTFATLKTDIADELERTDLSDAVLGKFVARCEDRILRDLPRLRKIETNAYIDVDAQKIPLPTNFVGLRRKYLDVLSSNRRIDYLSPDRFYSSRVFGDPAGGTPRAFTIEGDCMIFAPEPSATNPERIRINYYKSFDRLSTGTDTNWLLTNQFDVYLYGSLVHAGNYTREPRERIIDWNNYYKAAVEEVRRLSITSDFFMPNLRRTGGTIV